MNNNELARIRQARKDKGLTQSDVAQKLSLSRPSYIKIEEGKKDLTLSQAEELEKLLGITISESPEQLQAKISKFRSMILATIHFAGAESDGRIPKTKLAKILYFIDAQRYLDTGGTTMSHMVYRKLPQGPVPFEFFQSIDEMVDRGVISIKFSGLAQMIGSNEPFFASSAGLNAEELSLIERVSIAWKDKRTDAIVGHSHDHDTWQKAEYYEPIDMSLLESMKMSIY